MPTLVASVGSYFVFSLSLFSFFFLTLFFSFLPLLFTPIFSLPPLFFQSLFLCYFIAFLSRVLINHVILLPRIRGRFQRFLFLPFNRNIFVFHRQFSFRLLLSPFIIYNLFSSPHTHKYNNSIQSAVRKVHPISCLSNTRIRSTPIRTWRWLSPIRW